MYIKKLYVKGLRIIEEATLVPSSGINLITGSNGAGKTSYLESIYLLGRGRSFRHRLSGPFIQEGKKSVIVLADIEQEKGKSSRLGVERSSSTIRVKQDGELVNKRSGLLKALPLQIIAPNSHELIEKGPETRRSFLDYGMFHVEHGYLDELTDYNRALKQRNAALRRNQLDVVRSYNPLLSRMAVSIQGVRSRYIKALKPLLDQTLAELDIRFSVQLDLNPGMDVNVTLEQQLADREVLDLKRGFTGVGIHRADLVINSENVAAAHRLSRGQQKVLVYALKIAQSRAFAGKTGQHPIMLVDDLAAELDQRHLKSVMGLFQEMGAQVFVTLISREQLSFSFDVQLFHVEHGLISPLHQ